MEKLKKEDLRLIKEDHAEARKFIKEVSLKLRRRRSHDDESLSLFSMMTEQPNQ